MRQIAYESYLASIGYPKLLIDNNKTYYLAYETEEKRFVYDINNSCICIDLNSTNKLTFFINEKYNKFKKYYIKSIFPREQHIIYSINDKNITIIPFDERKLCNQQCDKNKPNKTTKTNETNKTK